MYNTMQEMQRVWIIPCGTRTACYSNFNRINEYKDPKRSKQTGVEFSLNSRNQRNEKGIC
jgi:hypothetical protein